MKAQILTLATILSLTLLNTGYSKENAATQTAPESSIKLPRAKSPMGAKVFIIEPANGATVSNPVVVKFGIQGMELAPAGEVKDKQGHHHLLVDVDLLPPLNQPLPSTDKVIHFGKAQTETTLTLSPGEHTLQLLLAGGNHVPNDPPVMSKKIKIKVK
ncbi:MAG: DUF4399 domain-containing protein [Deltaproteobacteria bacterium]|nr:DUF4399 domain-containing protein [Deltaproteobacteria bacterium]